MRVLTADQMREADARGMARKGEVSLMRAAGYRLNEAIERFAPGHGPVVAFAGPGNNGGDAFAALALVDRERSRTVYAMEAAAPTPARTDAESRAAIAGVTVRPFPQTREEAADALRGATVVLDAMLGTGSRAAPSGRFVSAIEALNAFPRASVLAVDIPTGIDASSGAVAEHAVQAGLTVTLGALKFGLLLDPARALAGDLYLGDIDLGPEIPGLDGPQISALVDDEFLALLPRRADNADKRSAGAPLVIAGSRQFPGAAVLCALGAARAGAGYVTVATPNDTAALVRAHLVEQVVVGYDERSPKAAIETLLDLTNHFSAVALGPGLGLSAAMGKIVRGFVAKSELPFVADASALFHFAKRLEMLRGKRCVLTPHSGEFARLSGEGTVAENARVPRLRAFVERTGITTLLKGRTTLIDDGTTLHVNTTGTNALATAGTGDVLTGMIGTLLAQGLAPVDAARVAAHWHGLAGRVAHARRRVGVIAGDIPELLAAALEFDPAPPQDRLLRIY